LSRTDKTAPYFVKMQWIPVAHHDHRFGPCTLPEKPNPKYVWTWRERYGKCYWDTDWNHPIYRCGCSMCGYDNRGQNRKSRHRAKAAIKAERWDDLRKTEGPNNHWC